AAGNVTHLVDGGDVGAYLGKKLVASLGRAVRLRSLLFLELFGGCGRVAASAQAMGYAALSLDINASPLENHLTPALQDPRLDRRRGHRRRVARHTVQYVDPRAASPAAN
ncbi:unnamed protein product, partial [Prorocentrum cordatum]